MHWDLIWESSVTARIRLWVSGMAAMTTAKRVEHPYKRFFGGRAISTLQMFEVPSMFPKLSMQLSLRMCSTCWTIMRSSRICWLAL
ncbi:UNVERIFIED_CONTAM: hypothetical protein LK11_48960 [Mumia flava]